ncbi:MAG: hypothetical protein JO360_18935, partial [Acidobacteria bacterium]|nr:hypothetical protein [Acidobacteriota bacterium]
GFASAPGFEAGRGMPPPQALPPLPAYGQPAGPVCASHPYAPPHVICRDCGAVFCSECPKYVGNVPICPACGDLCKPFKEIREKSLQIQRQSAGFGFNEFGLALVYPFRHILSVIVLSIFYSFISLFGMKGQIVAWGVLFGCMSHVINQFAWGATDCGLFPPFESFSWWDNVIRPMFLSIGIYIISFGPVIVLSIAVLLGVLTIAAPTTKQGPAAPIAAPQQQEPTYSAPPVRGTTYDGQEYRRYEVPQPTAPNAGPKSDKKSDAGVGAMMLILGLSGGVLALFGLALAWAIFYYPMALLVAGYTEDFWAVVNPVVGLDTIRRMGMNYVKAFFMYLVVEVVGIVMMAFFFIALSPFNMPFVGNLPALFMSGISTFWSSMVVAVILGFALFKSGDKLDLGV